MPYTLVVLGLLSLCGGVALYAWHQRRNPLAVLSILGTLLGYILAVLFLKPVLGDGILALSSLPVILAAGLFGLRVGLLAGLLIFPLNILLLSLLGQSGWGIGSALLGAVVILTGALVGRLRDLNEVRRHELVERRQMEGELRRRDAILAALARVSERLLISGAAASPGLSLDDALPEVLAQLGQAAGVSRVGLFENHAAGGGALLTSLRHEWVAEARASLRGNSSLQPFDYQAEGLERWVESLGAGRPLVGLVRHFPQRERAWLAGLKISALLALPVFCQSDWWGFLAFADEADERQWSSAEVEALRSAASALGAALARQAIEAAERQQSRHRELLSEIARLAIEQRDFQALLQALADRLRELFAADHSFVSLWDDRRRVLLPMAASGPHRETYLSLSPKAGEISMMNSVLEAGHVLVAEDVLNSPHLSPSLAAQFSVHSALGLPLIASRQRLGGVLLAFSERKGFGPEEIELAEQAAKQTALAVAQARLFRAITDEHSRLRAVIESSRDGVILVSMDQQVLLINAPALDFLRLPGQPEEWLYHSTRDLLRVIRREAPKLARNILVEMRRVRRGDEPPAEGEYKLPPRTIHWLSLPVMAGRDLLGRLLVLRDVTHERLVAEMRDDLTHMMVHDLRSPLGTISTALEFLHADVGTSLPDEQSQTLAIARESTAVTLDLVNAILDLSRLESGQMELDRAPIALADLVEENLRLQSPLASARELLLEANVPASLPLVWADPELIGRVLQNLVSNAVKFTPAGGRISLMGLVESSERPHVVVAVSDTGPGIPPHIHKRLFQKFVTGWPVQGRRGSGLGLAFCKLVVEAHGGRIWAESQPGRGTSFIFTLPTLPPDEEGARPLASTDL